MTLDEFVQDERDRLTKFEAWWRRMHAKDPEAFPLDMGKNNAGLWSEMLMDFDPDREENDQ